MVRHRIGLGIPKDHRPPEDGTALDVLEYEDRHLHNLFEQLEATSGPSVTDRSEHGDLCKQLVRRLAIREAALFDVVKGLGSVAELSDTLSEMTGAIEPRRNAIVRLDVMARGVTGMDLNRGQDFESAILSARQIIDPEIDWQLATGIPTIREQVSTEVRSNLLHDGRYLRRHAPTHPGTGNGRWYERTGALTRLVAAWDHMRDRPRPLYRSHRAE